MMQDAVLRRLIVIGEAASRVSSPVRASYPMLPWRRIIGFRNFVVHEYQKIDWLVIWQVTQSGIPELCHAIPPIMDRLSRDQAPPQA